MKGTRYLADPGCCHRRDFLQTVSAAAGALTFAASSGSQAVASHVAYTPKKTPAVHGAFIYPPTESLEEEGYWSWPGSSFKPEEMQSEYASRIAMLAKELQVQVVMNSTPLDTNVSVREFSDKVNRSNADGVLLVLFKKFHWDRLMAVLEAVNVPAVVVAPIGVLLAEYVLELRGRDRTYLINSSDVFQPLAQALRAISASRRMQDSLIVDIRDEAVEEATEKCLGTRLRRVLHEHYYEVFRQVRIDDRVKELAHAYIQGAKEIIEPSQHDITEAARSYFALRQILEEEKGDALMMDCLPGLRKPHRHVPPCMGFMSLHDEGIVAGCQSDLEATLTMLIVRNLVEKPAFQNNPCLDTERNHFFGAHCTAPSKMAGFDSARESYILRSHNEAGWGCVPQVLFREGQEVTMLHYFSEEIPKMSIYTGEVVCCYPKLPGGCRTNVEMTVNELEDVRDLVHGGHQIICYGHHSKQLKMFCQLNGIEAVT